MAAKKKKDGRGGPRPNSGRPKGSTTTEGWKSWTHSARPSMFAKVEALAKSEGLTRSQFVNRAIEKEIKSVERRAKKK